MNHYAPKIIFVFLIAFLSQFKIHAQVGINTTTPRTTLEVAGDMENTGSVDIGTIDPLQNGDTNTFLVQRGDGTILTLNVSNPTGAALGYIQEYEIENMFYDWIADFDTEIDSSEYDLITISANFDIDLDLPNADNLSDNFSLPFTSTFESGGTWHITANYPVAGNFTSGQIGTWTITTLIFSKDLSKQFGTTVIPMANGTTGAAVTPIID